MKLSFHTYHQQSPGCTSLELGISYTKGLLNEDQISNAVELAIGVFVRDISKSIVESARKERQRQVSEQASQRDSLDEILEQVLCESTHLSTV